MLLTMHTTNASFTSRDNGRNYADLDAARRAAVAAASQMALAELTEEKQNAAVEVVMEDDEGMAVVRLVVWSGVSDLLTKA